MTAQRSHRKTALLISLLCLCIIIGYLLSFYWRAKITQLTWANTVLRLYQETLKDLPLQTLQRGPLSVDRAQLMSIANEHHFIYHQDRDIHTLHMAQPTPFNEVITALAPLVSDTHCLVIAVLHFEKRTENTVVGDVQLKEKKACHA